jgi:hypothetical protein
VASQQTSGINHVLSDQEIESVRSAQELYGAQAKLGAIELASTLGMDPDERQALLGKVAVSIEDMDFETRRVLAASFQNVAACVGGTATGSLRPLPIVPESPVSTNGHGAQSELSAFGLGNNGNGNGNGHRPEETYVDRLTAPQKTWLKKLMGEDQVSSVAALSYQERMAFANSLSELYQGLSIKRLGPEAKELRGNQMIALLSGSTYEEIAKSAGVSRTALVNGLSTAATGIASRVSLEEILDLVSKAQATDSPAEPAPAAVEVDDSSQDPTDGETIAIHEPLTRTQVNWLRKALGDSFDEAEINNLPTTQREHLGELICRQVRSIFIPKDKNMVKTKRRTEGIEMIVAGYPYETIANTLGVSLPNAKYELHYTALSFNNNVPEHERQSIIERAKQYTGEDDA